MADASIFQDVAEYIRISKDALNIFKTAYGLLPKGEKRDDIERRVRAAEDALRRSDVALAQKLGYDLCQCTWPPQIMLWHNNERVFVCPRPECGRRIQTSYSKGTQSIETDYF
jgi:hypothetical protein